MKLFLTGGFLGSGKTTAIQQACLQLTQKNIPVAAIMNDQGDQLVDSEYLRHIGIPVREVTNGCFCCNYEQLENNIQSLYKDFSPEIIFAESVGSCADLVATITRPLAQFHPEMEVVLAIFADASLLWSLMNGNSCFLDDSVQYIYKKQLEEADILVINKTDLLDEPGLEKVAEIVNAEYPARLVLFQNSLDENNIRNWIDTMYNFKPVDTRKALAIDYDIYGEGEARLAWLDKKITIYSTDRPATAISEDLINTIYEKIHEAKLPIGHIKFFLDDGDLQQKISYTTVGNRIYVPVDMAPKTRDISLLINARVQTDPEVLAQIIDEAEKEISLRTGSTIIVNKLAAFQPGYPRPTHRMTGN
jgi:Ni2+-binding GTPase involved in maturation of urease and hydrogenase